MLTELHFQARISNTTTCASTTSPKTAAYIQTRASSFNQPCQTYSRRQSETSTSTFPPTCLSFHAQSFVPGRDARDDITIRKGAMLTISLVNNILASLQQEHEAMQGDSKARRPTSSTNACHEEQAWATRSINVNDIDGYKLQKPTSGRSNAEKRNQEMEIVRVVSQKTRSFNLAAYVISSQLHVILNFPQPNL